MIITVGICKELGYIAKISGSYTTAILQSDPWVKLKIGVSNSLMMEIWYNDIKIWAESLDDSNMFGIESIDSISRIISCLDNKDQTWASKYPSPEDIS